MQAYQQSHYEEAEQHWLAALESAQAFGAQDLRSVQSINNLGKLYRTRSQYTQAESFYRRALVILEQALGPEHPEVARSLNNLTGIYHAKGEYAKAEPMSQRALAIREKSLDPEHSDVAESLHNLAKLYLTRGQYSKVEPLSQRALAIWEKALGAEHPNVAATLNNLADLHKALGRYSKAEPLYRRALAIREKALGPEHPDMARNLNGLALLHYTQGQYAEAELLYQRALVILEKTLGSEHPEVARSLNDLGELYRTQGQYTKAEPLLRRALAIKDKALGPEHPEVARSFNSLAALYRARGQYTKAEPLYRRALVILENVLDPEHPEVARSFNNLAGIYHAKGEYAKAEPLLQRALAIREKALGPEHPKFAVSLNNLAVLYSTLGQYTKAEPLFRRGLAIKEKALGTYHSGTAESLYNLAKLYVDQGQYAQAEPLSQRALAIWEKDLGPEHPFVAVTLNNLADIYKAQEQYAKAEPLYRRALAIRENALGPGHPDIAYNLSTLALLYSAQGQHAKAELLYRRALAILENTLGPEHPDMASNLNSLALLYYTRGEYANGISFAQRATAIHRNRLVPLTEHRLESNSHVRGSHRSGFFRHIQLISRVIEEQPQHRQTLINEAFEVSQLAQSSGAAAAVAQMAVRSAAGNPALSRLVHAHQDAINQWRTLNAVRLKQWSDNAQADGRPGEAHLKLLSQIGSLEDRMQALKTQLRQQFPEYAQLNDPQPASLSETRQLLAPDEALLVYLIGEEESYLWVVRRDRFAMHRLVITTDALNQAVAKLRGAFNKDDIKPFNLKLAYRLHSQLVAPASPLLENVQHIFLKADSALQSLPFATLITTAPQTTFVFPKHYSQQPWLGTQYAFTTLPAVNSMKMLRRLTPSPAAGKPFIGFGAPVFQGQPGGLTKATYSQAFRGVLADVTYLRRLSSLPETAPELKRIAHYLNAGDEVLYLGERATESQLKSLDLSSVRIVAFSTHGLLAHEAEALHGPAEPALALTPPAVATGHDDGLLTASEVTQLNFNADWIILSACNTAVPDSPNGGEGLSALAKAFFYAGSRSLLVSHWYVASLATSKLMIGLFEQLAKDPHMRRAEALRMAMENLINDTEYAHPIYWAPFVVVGEGGSVATGRG